MSPPLVSDLCPFFYKCDQKQMSSVSVCGNSVELFWYLLEKGDYFLDKLTSLKINVLDLGNKLLYWLLLVRELSFIRANEHTNKTACGQDSIQILFSLKEFLSKTLKNNNNKTV